VTPPTANPISEADARILMVILARYEGAVRGKEVDDHNIQRLAARCTELGLLDPTGPTVRNDLAQVLADIGQRLRYAIGEYPSDPTVVR
jgi:hypothetical protein